MSSNCFKCRFHNFFTLSIFNITARFYCLAVLFMNEIFFVQKVQLVFSFIAQTQAGLIVLVRLLILKQLKCLDNDLTMVEMIRF